MRRRSAATAGFTLLEMMVALFVGAVSVVVAAKVAQVVIRQSARGQEFSDFNSKSRLLARQLRVDLRAAGYGSTGAIAVDPTSSPWNAGLGFVVNGKRTIPAIAGANALPAMTINTTPVRERSDALMLVVPNPGLSGRTDDWTRAGANNILLGPYPTTPAPTVQPLARCNTGFVYVVDHTAPNGAGRVQLMTLNNVTGNTVTTVGVLQFTMAPGSTVMCARISTYWIDEDGWLHRTDFTPGGNPTRVQGEVWVDNTLVGQDHAVPGVLDLQIAYRFSSEVYSNANLAVPAPANLSAQWAFEGDALNLNGMLGDPASWFEVRRARINLLLRANRSADPRETDPRTLTSREDGPVPTVPRSMRVDWVTTTETLTNLRYFDFGAPVGVRPEPF